ncbi:MAG: hypothetical protein JW820_03055 [Spirochaetales bacterium]|nr:hypothetical protein [Spirochaetales bacterium]
MNLAFVLELVTRWELLLIAGILMILIPLVSYIASVRRGPRRRRFLSPADRALVEPPRGPVES